MIIETLLVMIFMAVLAILAVIGIPDNAYKPKEYLLEVLLKKDIEIIDLKNDIKILHQRIETLNQDLEESEKDLAELEKIIM